MRWPSALALVSLASDEAGRASAALEQEVARCFMQARQSPCALCIAQLPIAHCPLPVARCMLLVVRRARRLDEGGDGRVSGGARARDVELAHEEL